MAYKIGTPTATQFLDANGDPANGHTLEFFVEGTSTPANIAFDTAGSSTATSVTIGTNGLPASGGSDVSVYFDEDVTYDIVRKDAGGVAFGPTIRSYSVSQEPGAGAAIGVLSSAGSAANAIMASLPTSPGSLTDQLQVVVELQHGANTIVGATFNLNSLGEKTIKRDNNQPLAIGDTGGTGYKAYFSYSATNDVWVLLNPVNPIGQGLEWVRGLEVTNNATDSAHDIDIATGRILDSTEARIISLTSAITKQIDANWAEGDDAGGFPSGLTLAADTCYRVFLIAKADGTVDAGFDTSATATNLLADATTYTYYRRVGWVITDSSSNIIAFVDGGNNITYLDVPVVVSITESSSAKLETVIAPPEVPAILLYRALNGTGTERYALLTQTDQTDSTPSATIYTLKLPASGTNDVVDTVVMELKTDSSRQIRHREDAPEIEILSLGYRDDLTVS